MRLICALAEGADVSEGLLMLAGEVAHWPVGRLRGWIGFHASGVLICRQPLGPSALRNLPLFVVFIEARDVFAGVSSRKLARIPVRRRFHEAAQWRLLGRPFPPRDHGRAQTRHEFRPCVHERGDELGVVKAVYGAFTE